MKLWIFTPVLAFTLTEMALGSDAVPTPAPAAPVAAAEAAPAASPAFVSDGNPLEVKHLGFRITPPTGWEVQTNAAGMSVVMQEPKAPVIDVAKLKEPVTTFRRNITVTSFKEAMPVDEAAAKTWKAKLAEIMGKNGAVQNLNVSEEHKFFDYRKKDDGLVIYAGYMLSGVPMMQVNVIVSGEKNAFLMTYVDTAASFQANPAIFNAAWASMVSVDVTGDAPWRYAPYAKAGATGGALLFLAALAFLFRWRASRRLMRGFDGDDGFDGADSKGDASALSEISAIVAQKKSRKDAGKSRKKAKSTDEDAISGFASLSSLSPLSDAQPLSGVSGHAVSEAPARGSKRPVEAARKAKADMGEDDIALSGVWNLDGDDGMAEAALSNVSQL